MLFSATLQADAISGMVMDITEKKQAEEKNKIYQLRLKSLASQLTIAEERERQRIAIELHDHLGQSLVFSRIQLAKLRQQVAKEKDKELIDELSQSLLLMIQDTKKLIFELSSPLLHEIGLSSAIYQFLTEKIGQKHELETEFIHKSQILLQDKELRTILFRNVRELLVNVVKHAHATKVTVAIENNNNHIKIITQDNGTGFIADNVFKVKSKDKFGLFSIHERMDAINGSLSIESEPGKGCTAIIIAPLQIS